MDNQFNPHSPDCKLDYQRQQPKDYAVPVDSRDNDEYDRITPVLCCSGAFLGGFFIPVVTLIFLAVLKSLEKNS